MAVHRLKRILEIEPVALPDRRRALSPLIQNLGEADRAVKPVKRDKAVASWGKASTCDSRNFASVCGSVSLSRPSMRTCTNIRMSPKAFVEIPVNSANSVTQEPPPYVSTRSLCRRPSSERKNRSRAWSYWSRGNRLGGTNDS